MRARPWTKAEIKLLGKLPDRILASQIGRSASVVWQKRNSLGIAQPHVLQSFWTPEEEKIVLSHSIQDSMKMINRSRESIKLHKGKLLRRLGPTISNSPVVKAIRRIPRPSYSSAQEEERFQLVGGPYYPPSISIGGCLKCQVLGSVQVGDWTKGRIPWPIKRGMGRQLIFCGDLLRALKTESAQAISFHFGISKGTVTNYRRLLGIERYTAGSWRLFRQTINLARTPEARDKLSQVKEGQPSKMSLKDRRRLRAIQRQPKPLIVRRKISERQRRKFRLLGPNRKWTAEELALVGTMRDIEVAKRTGRTLLVVRHRKFLIGERRQRQP